MTESASLSEADVRAVVRLLGDVIAVESGRGAQICHLMDGLCRLVNAEAWVWGMGVSLSPDTLPTWVIQFYGGFSDERFAKFMRAQEHPDLARLTAPFVELLVEKKTHLTRLRQQTDPEDRFRWSGARALWQEADIAPGILSLRPVDERSVNLISVYRRFDDPFFTERESRIAHILLTEVPWLHGVPASAAGVPKLAPRCRTVVNLLIQAQSRRQIADHLGISLHTANDYVKKVFNHFGVHSQAEFLRRFACGDGGDAG